MRLELSIKVSISSDKLQNHQLAEVASKVWTSQDPDKRFEQSQPTIKVFEQVSSAEDVKAQQAALTEAVLIAANIDSCWLEILKQITKVPECPF